jgi:hypothetical protein
MQIAKTTIAKTASDNREAVMARVPSQDAI